jgi:hypothetical protein
MNTCVDVSAPIAADGALDDLSRWLGRREAFGLMAGRCSAADAECMREIRHSKVYLSRAQDWPEFCVKYLHMSKSNANRLIGLLEKFGPEYFHIAQITGISAADYGAIAPCITPQGIASNGMIIPLKPENSEHISAAIQNLLEAHQSAEGTPPKDALAELEAAASRLLKQFRALSNRRGRSDPQVIGAVSNLQSNVENLLAEIE